MLQLFVLVLLLFLYCAAARHQHVCCNYVCMCAVVMCFAHVCTLLAQGVACSSHCKVWLRVWLRVLLKVWFSVWLMAWFRVWLRVWVRVWLMAWFSVLHAAAIAYMLEFNVLHMLQDSTAAAPPGDDPIEDPSQDIHILHMYSCILHVVT